MKGKARNIIRLGLFLFGVSLEFAGFWVSQVEHAPWVLRIVSPAYSHAMVAVRAIEAGNTLGPDDEGFSEISRVILGWLKQKNAPANLQGIFLLKVEPAEGSSMKMGTNIVFDIKRFRFFLSNNQDFVADTTRLQSAFEGLRSSVLFSWAFALLIAGIAVVQVPLFFIESAPQPTSMRGKQEIDRPTARPKDKLSRDFPATENVDETCERDKMNLVDYNDMVKSFHEESDRAAAVLAASFVDAYLADFLKSFMTDDEVAEELLGSFGPLGTFRARIECAFAFGLIRDSVRKDLNYIRKIRNVFAHDFTEVSFSTSPLCDLCQNLSLPQEVGDPRGRYLMVAGLAVGTLHNTMLANKKLSEK